MSIPKAAVSPVLDPQIRQYLVDLLRLGSRPGSGPDDDDPLVAQMEAIAEARGFPHIGRATGRWLELLTRAVGGRRVFEFGSGYGFSAFFFARATGEGGEVIGTEVDQPDIDTFHQVFDGHPLRSRIDIRHGLAADIFRATEGHFDVVLLDCHKEDYLEALELSLPRLRPGGLLLADNALWGGRVARPAAEGDTATAALQQFNERIHADERLLSGILPVGDGLAVCLRV